MCCRPCKRWPKGAPRRCRGWSRPWIIHKGRYWATLVLAEMGPGGQSRHAALATLLDDKDPEVRMQSALALAEIGAMTRLRRRPALINGLADKAEAVRYASAYAVGKIGATDAIPALEKAEADNDPFLKMVSAWAIAKLKPEDQAATATAAELIVAGAQACRPERATGSGQGAAGA